MMNNISMEVHIEDILMTKFVSLCRMVELSICDSFLDPRLKKNHNCGGHDEQHLHGGQHQGHPHDQVCVTLQDGGVLRGVVDIMNNISMEVHIEDILMTKFVSLCKMVEFSIVMSTIVVDMMNNIYMEVNIEDILMTKFVSLYRMVESSEFSRMAE